MTGQNSWRSDASSTAGHGGVVLGFAAFGGAGSSSSSSSQWQGSQKQDIHSEFHNTATNLTISLEYGLCSIVRPWLVSDLFYMKNWYLVGNRKNAISDGTIAGQANNATPLLPMIPQQFLVIRNVKITSTNWGSDSDTLKSYFSQNEGGTSSGSSSASGGGGVSLGFISFGGSANHNEHHSAGQQSNWSSRSKTDNYGTSFNGQELTIQGAQIVAFLNDIVPAAAPLDDPAMKK